MAALSTARMPVRIGATALTASSPASRRLLNAGSSTSGRARPITSVAPSSRAAAMPSRLRKPPVTISGTFTRERTCSA